MEGVLLASDEQYWLVNDAVVCKYDARDDKLCMEGMLYLVLPSISYGRR